MILGRGDGSFQPVEKFNSGGSGLAGIAVSDVNGDGHQDVIEVASLTAGVLLGNGDGTLRAGTIISTGIYGTSVIAADLNHDGKPDMIIGATLNSTGHENVGVLLGNGDGTFQPIQLFDTNAVSGSGLISMVTGDVNGDGKLDVIGALACAGPCNTTPIMVLLGNGNGTLQKAQRFLSGGENRGAPGIALVDLNGDSKPDIAVTNQCVNSSDCSTGTVGILPGTAGVQTTTTVTSSPNPSIYGQAVTLTASVTSVGNSVPTGAVGFLNGSSAIATVTLVGGVASTTKTNLSAGSLSITAKYSGDLNSAKSTSTPLIQVVHKASTKTTVSSSLNPSTEGQSVTFTAVVTSATTRPTGTVTFTSGGQTLGTITLSGGRAKLTTSALPLGSDQVTATYNGTSNISGSKGSVTQVVN